MNGCQELPCAARADVLGVQVDTLDLGAAVERILSRVEARTPGDYVCLCNVHLIAEADSRPDVRAALNGAYLNLPDGMPVVWYCRWRGHGIRSNVRGADLMAAVCAAGRARGVRHLLYGGEPAVLEILRSRLEQKSPGLQIVDAISPPFRALTDEEQKDLIERVNDARADLVWVCLGAPRQELWMRMHAGVVTAPLMLGVGAAFDFLAATKRPAPLWMQRRGLEWLFRLAQEPRRLWRRYTMTGSRFLWKVAKQVFAGARTDRNVCR